MKKYIQTICFLFLATLLTGCSDWLDIDPKDKTLESKQFSSEQGIHSVLNGLYMEMASTDLYGGKLTISDIEHLGHYYYAPPDKLNSNYLPFFNLQSYNYEDADIQARFSKIWSDAYALILRTNVFIKNVEESTVISEENRNLMLGEAYAMRAFLHFDMFRLFGPVYADGAGKLSIPYNDKAELTVYSNIISSDFMTKVITDITTAKLLLKDDPILYVGVLKSSDMTQWSAEERFIRCLRNRRFNLLSVKMLESRVLFYMGEQDQAAQKALEFLSDNKIKATSEPIFDWVDYDTMKERADYVLHSEVVFGIENNKLYSSWSDYTEAVIEHSIYGIRGSNLYQNIFDAPVAGAYGGNDIRFQQWRLSAARDIYISSKYKKSNIEATSLIYSLQALMRMSELHYIIAEEAMERNDLVTAVKKLNLVLKNRGLKTPELLSETAPPSKNELEVILEKEYYREFYAEGQVFFFHKRRNDTKMFSTNSTGHVELEKYPIPSTGSIYVVPLPKSETNN